MVATIAALGTVFPTHVGMKTSCLEKCFFVLALSCSQRSVGIEPPKPATFIASTGVFPTARRG